MRKETQVGDVLKNGSGIVVHGCNALGVMGSGIAKQIHQDFPDVYQDYRSVFERDGLRVGDVIWSPPRGNREFWVANAITQERFGRDPRVRYVCYNAIEICFEKIARKAIELTLPVFYPKIGAGLGNGNWSEISKMISEKLIDVDHQLWLHPTDPDAKKSFKIK